MARTLVITIRDNDTAERIARLLIEGNARGLSTLMPPEAKLDAMIARPTSGCHGPHRVSGKIKPERGFSRTKRFGWFICGVCKRPADTVVQNFIRNMLGGCNNLLPELSGGEPEKPYWVKETLQAVQHEMNKR